LSVQLQIFSMGGHHIIIEICMLFFVSNCMIFAPSKWSPQKLICRSQILISEYMLMDLGKA
jgi:hypothetical protein